MTKKSKFLVVTAESLTLTTLSDGSVGIHVKNVEASLGLLDNVALMLRLSAEEARLFAQALNRKADEASTRLPQDLPPIAEPPQGLQ